MTGLRKRPGMFQHEWLVGNPLLIIVPVALVAAIAIPLITKWQQRTGVANGQANVATTLPAGWRLPKPEEEEFPGDAWRNRDRERYLVVRGDFDGDGKEDQARLLVNSDGTKHALFVFLGSGASVQLIEQDAETLKAMGIDKLEPGTYTTACGKGYWSCEPGEPESVRPSNPSILYFKAESAESAYIWSVADRAFQRVWLSD